MRAKRRAALAQLDSLTQSIFLDLFGDPGENPKRWPIPLCPSMSLSFRVANALRQKAARMWLRGTACSRSAPSQERSFYAHASESGAGHRYEPPVEHFAKPGDLLLQPREHDEFVGAVAYVDTAPPNVLLPDKLWRFVWRKPAWWSHSSLVPFKPRHFGGKSDDGNRYEP